MKKHIRWGMIVLFAVSLLLSTFSFSKYASAGEENPQSIKGRVLSVVSGETTPTSSGGFPTQIVTIKLTSKDYNNQIITVKNTLTGHPLYDIEVKEGDRVLIQRNEVDGVLEYHIADFSRETPLLIITVFFVLCVLLFGGIKGLKAVISLVVMGLVILYLILPLILRGFNPIVVTVGLSSVMTGFFLFFIGGFNRKTTAAILGTVGGLLAAGLLAYVVGNASYLTGLASSEAQMLQFMESNIDFQGLLFAGIIIGALGAILDVGISIASAMEQIKEAAPESDFKTLLRRGLHVGRDMMATMSNTLILAYVGSALPLLLLFQASNSSWSDIINLDLIATEIVRAMAGSIGLTLAIPLTALAAGFLLIKPIDKN